MNSRYDGALSSLRNGFKRALFIGLKRTGISNLVRNSAWRTARLPILCYHGIALEDEDQWDPTLYISPERFETRMRKLSEGGYKVISLREGVRQLYAGSLSPRSVTITFDDGNHDFYVRALPVLRRYGFRATVYLTTFYSDFNRPVFAVFCSWLLWKADATLSANAAEMVGLRPPLNFSSPEGRGIVLDGINRYAADRKWTASEKDDIIDMLAGCLGLDIESMRRRRILHLMTPSEVAQCAADGIEIELHTHRHRTPDDKALFVREVRENRERIEEMTGIRPVNFCYPSGVYRAEFLPWLREEEVQSATTCEFGLAARTSDPLLLPRIVDTSNLDEAEFEAWLSGSAAAARSALGTVPMSIVTNGQRA